MEKENLTKDPFDSIYEECRKIRLKKSLDYQNPLTTVKHADHYPNGVQTIFDMVWQKMIRLRSIIEMNRRIRKINSPDAHMYQTNYESLRDTILDAINYLTFMAVWLDGKIDGQHKERDMFNQP